MSHEFRSPLEFRTSLALAREADRKVADLEGRASQACSGREGMIEEMAAGDGGIEKAGSAVLTKDVEAEVLQRKLQLAEVSAKEAWLALAELRHEVLHHELDPVRELRDSAQEAAEKLAMAPLAEAYREPGGLMVGRIASVTDLGIAVEALAAAHKRLAEQPSGDVLSLKSKGDVEAVKRWAAHFEGALDDYTAASKTVRELIPKTLKLAESIAQH
jgi:hypothetical protein